MDKPTQAQAEAINSLDCNVSVSAGAGSGKTRVLVERFLHIIEVDKAHCDEILAITFTKKAAKEMRERVRESLYEILNKTTKAKEKEKWQKELALLDKAQISTIDSFCSKVLRENPVEAVMDPNFTTSEQYEQDDFYSTCTEDFILEEVQANNGNLLVLLNAFSKNSVVSTLLSHIDKLQDINAFNSAEKAYSVDDKKKTQAQTNLLNAFNELMLHKEEPKAAGTKKTLEAFGENSDKILAAMQAMDYEALANFNLDSTMKSKEIQDFIDEFKEAYNTFKTIPINERAEEVAEAWKEIFHKYATYLAARAQKEEVFGFSEIFNKATDLLSSNKNVLKKYTDKYKFIMVDEFQDTNQKQRELVYLLAGGYKDKLSGNKLFIVGDPKQSIYRFRGADVSVFTAVCKDIKNSKGKNISLKDNYRSSPEILNACNAVFADLMGASDSEIPFEELNPNKASCDKPALYLIEYEKGERPAELEAEATLLAQKIKELVEKDEGITYGSVAILLKAINKASYFAQALGKEGINYQVLDGKGFYERQEIVDLVNLLSFLNNYRNNLALVGVLRSPYFGINDNTITILLRSMGADETLWSILPKDTYPSTIDAEQTELLHSAAVKLQELLMVGETLNLTELLKNVFRVLNLDILLTGQLFGDEKLANVYKFKALADDFSVKKGGSLKEFLDSVTTLREFGSNEGSAVVENTNDVVTIMTIHKSKGLQFPVVVLPYLNTTTRNDGGIINFSLNLGLGVKIKDNNGQIVETEHFLKVKEENNNKETQEKLRQLYVAMTRAERYLILSGGVEKDKKAPEKEGWLDSLRRVYGEDNNKDLVEINTVQLETIKENAPEKSQIKAFGVSKDIYAQSAPLPDFLSPNKNFFSASALQEYDMCSRKYYYNQILHMPQIEPEQLASNKPTLPAYQLGLVIHSALELMAQDSLKVAVEEAIMIHEISPVHKKYVSDLATKMLKAYCASDLYKDYTDLTKEAEYNFTLPLFNLDGEDIWFTGSIDSLIHYKDGSLGIIDYKTGRPPEQGEEKTGYIRQLVIYLLAAKTIFGKEVKNAELHFLQNNSVCELPKDRDALIKQLQEFVKEIRQKKEEQDFSVSLQGCQYCPYSYFCKKK